MTDPASSMTRRWSSAYGGPSSRSVQLRTAVIDPADAVSVAAAAEPGRGQDGGERERERGDARAHAAGTPSCATTSRARSSSPHAEQTSRGVVWWPHSLCSRWTGGPSSNPP